MQSKEEIENGKAHLGWMLDNGILTSEDDSHVEAVLEYIEQLESEKQKLIEKLEEDINRHTFNDIEKDTTATYAEEILKKLERRS